ncbi:DUF983 domain-containing protein [soil metagenome]
MNKILSIAKGKCPCCHQGDVFTGKRQLLPFKFPPMNEKCAVCDLRFEKEPGFFYGSMYVSYALGIWEGVIIFLLGGLFVEEIFDVRILYAFIASQVILRVVNYRLSRLIWMHMFVDKEKCEQWEMEKRAQA